MKIPFMLKFPSGEETHFIEKLWVMAIQQKYVTLNLKDIKDTDLKTKFNKKIHD